MKKQNLGLIALFTVAIIWGLAFIAVDYAISKQYGPFTILAIRGILSGLLLLPFAIKDKIWKNKNLLLHCMIAGVFFFLGYLTQTIGQMESGVINSAFFTCLYCIFTPFIALLFGKKEVKLQTFIAAILALMGIYFLSVLSNGGSLIIKIADILLILCAFFFALQIIWAGHFIKGDVSPASTSSIMLLTMGILSTASFFIFNESLPPSISGIDGVLFATLFSSGVCSILQLFGQKHVPSGKASIILSLETPFACIFSVLILPNEHLNIYSIIGLSLMFISVLLVEIKIKRKINLNQYKYLLFDIDDTILDFQKAELNAFKMLLADYNIPFNEEYYKVYKDENHRLWKEYELQNIQRYVIFENRMIPLFNLLNIEDDPKKASYKMLEYLSKGAYLIGNSYKKLEELSKKYKLYIISNGEPTVQYPRLIETDIIKFFDKVFISEEIGYQKPMKEFFKYVEDHIDGFNKDEALVIGDSLTSDIKGAINYGIDACWFNPNGKSCDLPIKYVISSIEELK